MNAYAGLEDPEDEEIPKVHVSKVNDAYSWVVYSVIWLNWSEFKIELIDK